MQEEVQSSQLSNRPFFEKRESYYSFINHHLKDVGTIFQEVAFDEKLRKKLYKEIEKQFDGDYNVLVQTFIKDNPLKIKGNKNTSPTLEMISTGFKPIVQVADKEPIKKRDITLYQQIHIPFYEELKANDLLNKKGPTFVFYNGNKEELIEADTKLKGYIYEGDSLTELSALIDEEYALNNEVWVFSFNEYSDFIDPVTLTLKSYIEDKKDNSIRYRINSSAINDNGIDLVIGNVKIKCHKESWVAGKSDLALNATTFKGAEYNTNPIWRTDIVGNCSGWNAQTLTMNSISLRKFSRAEVTNQTSIAVNADFTTYSKTYVGCGVPEETATVRWGYKHPTNNYLSDERADYLNYVLYEHDALDPYKKPPYHTQSFHQVPYLNSIDVHLIYYSYESAYAGNIVSIREGDAVYFVKNANYKNDCIEYNLQVRTY